MHEDALTIYRMAFSARCEAARRPGDISVDGPGACGSRPATGGAPLRLLVTDDRAHELLGEVAPAGAGSIDVFAWAERCVHLVAGQGGWSRDEVTAMICRDLRSAPEPMLPAELTLRPVRRAEGGPEDGVPLEDAVAAVLRANPGSGDRPDAFAAYLRSLTDSTQLLCAVDQQGRVRATSGVSTTGLDALVFFVNTDPDWRGRGIGLAMTAAALHAGRASGATRACLTASDAGLSIYRRLGFESVGRTVRFRR